MRKIMIYFIFAFCFLSLMGCDSTFKGKDHNYYVVELKNYNDEELKKLETLGYIKEKFKVIQMVTLEVKENKLSELQKDNNIKQIKKIQNIKEAKKKEKRYIWFVEVEKEKSDNFISSLSRYGEIVNIDKKTHETYNQVLMILSEKTMIQMFKDQHLSSITKHMDKDDSGYREISTD